MRATPSRIWNSARRAKEAGEWWALLATLSLFPAAPVLLGLFEGEPWSVILLYATAALAFWIVLIAEAKPLMRALSRRKLEFDFLPECCMQSADHDQLISVGVRNIGAVSVHNALVRIDLPHVNIRARLLAWHGPKAKLGGAMRIDPSPMPWFHYHVGLAQTVNSGTVLRILFAGPEGNLPPGDYKIVLAVTGENATPTVVAATVCLKDRRLSLQRDPGMVGWAQREV